MSQDFGHAGKMQKCVESFAIEKGTASSAQKETACGRRKRRMSTKRKVKILGTGKYLPKRVVTAPEMDKMLSVNSGWTVRKSDVNVRHFIDGETASEMGALAVAAALKNAGLRMSDIDCLVCTSGTMEQPLPSTASLIQRELGWGDSGIPAFDMNSTCLSFVTGLDVMSYLVHAGRYRRIVLVSTEIASVGLNWHDKESSALFGDGAAAVVLGQSDENDSAAILHADMVTYGNGVHLSEIRGGGSRQHARSYSARTEEDYLFHMEGHAIFRMASKLLPAFTSKLLSQANCHMEDIDLVIPHQGSAMAMRLLSKKLDIPQERLMYITPDHGNTIAASIPMGIHEAVTQSRMQRGDRVLLLGTAAGLSLGGVVLVY